MPVLAYTCEVKMDNNVYITDAVREKIEELLLKGITLEIRLVKNKDGTKRIGIFQVETKRIE